jgi:hypothetical protein
VNDLRHVIGKHIKEIHIIKNPILFTLLLMYMVYLKISDTVKLKPQITSKLAKAFTYKSLKLYHHPFRHSYTASLKQSALIISIHAPTRYTIVSLPLLPEDLCYIKYCTVSPTLPYSLCISIINLFYVLKYLKSL